MTNKGGYLMNKRLDKLYNSLVRTIMFISSYFPLYIMITILYYKKIIEGFKCMNVFSIIVTLALGLFIIISIFSIVLLRLGKGSKEKLIEDLERPDDTVLSYIMTYIIPLVTNGDNTTEVYIANIFLFILIGYIYLRLNLIYLNPLWAMFGYMIYRDSNREVIITNISREHLKYMNKLKGYYLSNYVFVAHKKNNLEY